MRISFLILLSSFVLYGCIDKPNFPITPSIEYRDIGFYDDILVQNNSGSEQVTDQLQITIHFEDGDGDLGLSSNQNAYPYHFYNYYDRTTGQELNEKFRNTVLNLSNAIRYEDKRTGAIDTLPPLNPSIPCDNWQIIGQGVNADTLYFRTNPYYNNIFITFLVRDPQGTFEEFEFDCENYNGRFPVLLDENKEKAVEGTLTYNIEGRFLSDTFDRKIMKLRVYILDRDFHPSNIIETPEFILSEITR